MTREKAYKLASEVADAGYSAQVNIGVHPKMSPAEHCSAGVPTLRLQGVQLCKLLEIGEAHGCDLHMIGDGGLTYFELPVTS